MREGNYIAWFLDDEDEVKRSFIHKLENRGIIKVRKEKYSKDCRYCWELAEKGKKLLEGNEDLQELWNQEKVEEFFNKIN